MNRDHQLLEALQSECRKLVSRVAPDEAVLFEAVWDTFSVSIIPRWIESGDISREGATIGSGAVGALGAAGNQMLAAQLVATVVGGVLSIGEPPNNQQEELKTAVSELGQRFGLPERYHAPVLECVHLLLNVRRTLPVATEDAILPYVVFEDGVEIGRPDPQEVEPLRNRLQAACDIFADDEYRRVICRGRRTLNLRADTYTLLILLLSTPPRVWKYEEILRRLGGDDVARQAEHWRVGFDKVRHLKKRLAIDGGLSVGTVDAWLCHLDGKLLLEVKATLRTYLITRRS